MSRAKGYANVGRLRRLLRRLPDDITAKVKDAIAEAAQLVQAEAEASAPRETGRMAGEISAKTSRDGLSAKVGFLGVKSVKRRAFYAKFIEFGTSKMPAKPFLFPALERSRAEISGRIRAAVNDALIRAASDNSGGSDE
jgi:HK97 gp10 family phage protein